MDATFVVLVTFLVVARLAELALAERNRRWAMMRGGVESGRGHYWILVGMHTLFYVSLVLERGFLSRQWDPLWPLWLAVLGLAQVLRVWVIVSLGRFWNTRIIVIPGTQLVRSGPYRFIRHPNYLVVATEILVIPLLCGAHFTALGFSLANGIVLYWRIREEERALASLPGTVRDPLPRFIPRMRTGRETRPGGSSGSGRRL